jgi:hypothetical protein
MAQQPLGRPERGRRQPARGWTLGTTAPGWLRRIWGERSRDVPAEGDPGVNRRKVSEADLARLRRIAYL